MKLKTTAILAACGVLLSTAGAFAIPVAPGGAIPDPATKTVAAVDKSATPGWGGSGSRVTAGDTLLVDARLGHASLPKAARGETYLFAQVTGADEATASAQGATTTPMNLAVVIDRSGSMKGDRIANAMNAAVTALERMREGDSISVVSFDTSAQVVVPPTRIASGNRSSIEAAIRSIRLGGDTCISCGLEEGMRQLDSATLGADRINRMILLSDGATNNGIKDMPGMRSLANRLRDRGVTVSTIGVDVDFDEKMMAAIASEANGRHYFVANSAGLPAVFGQEFDDLLASVAKEAELAIELAPGVEVAEVFDRSFRREGNKLFVSFGTFSAKQEKTVLVKLRVPTDKDGEQPVADLKLAFRDLLKKSDGSCTGNLTLAVKDDGSAQSDLDPFVAARLERSRTAQTLTEANKLFEQGRFSEAQGKLAARATAIKASESRALALAPTTAAPKKAKALDKDFDDQSDAIASAQREFAKPPPRVAAGAAPAPVSRDAKAQVRSNQARAFEMGF